ncbi:CD247 antigen like isoform X2 [Hoplias malabaricus]|uniref:CD247 antigen like isoform X2 n=1 Tax=Hoplias malabaricus TaxID=27720 RepID=UPI0034633D79
MGLSDPVTCYILDAFLLLYCIIFTGLYFRIKFSRMRTNSLPADEPVYEGLKTDEVNDEYQTLEPQSSQASGPTRRNRAQQEESQYEALKSPTNDDYQEIKSKGKPHKSKGKAKESGAKSRKDAAEAFEMETVPSIPSRS